VRELAQFGANAAGGMDRFVYTPAWQAARDQVGRWMAEAGLEVRSDAAGNLFGRLAGVSDRTILTGSHLDTVPNGGRLDGALGIIAGLVALDALREGRRPRKSLEVVATCEEEGSRFAANFWGARAIVGVAASDEPDKLMDADGITIRQAMADVGFAADDLPSAKRRDVDAFVELHIEQGPVLEQAHVAVGIVTAITGQYRAQATVDGRPDHAGTTPMASRSDALLAAARMVQAVNQAAFDFGPPAVATVGCVAVTPGAINVVPGQATFTLDVRHPDPAELTRLVNAVRGACELIAPVIWHELMYEPPQPLDQDLDRILGECASGLALRAMRLHSGAGHDAQIFARAFPTAMIFVPSQQGRSHSPLEFTATEDIVPGVRLLAAALQRLAY